MTRKKKKKKKRSHSHKSRKPIFRPISFMPELASVIDGMADDSKEQLENFEEARLKPHVMDDKTINRALKLFRERLELLFLDSEQLYRWKNQPITDEQRREVERLIERVDENRLDVERLIAMAEEIKKGTIDRIMEKDDFELGMEVVSGLRPPPFSSPEIDKKIADIKSPPLKTPLVRAQAALGIHKFVEELKSAGASSEEEIMTHPETFLFMCNFKGIMDNAEPGELDELAARMSGFYAFSKMLENLAQAIQDGKIKVPG